MEPMEVTVLSLKERHGGVQARVRADADKAQIHLLLWFPTPTDATAVELWALAYHEALKYLDPA